MDHELPEALPERRACTPDLSGLRHLDLQRHVVAGKPPDLPLAEPLPVDDVVIADSDGLDADAGTGEQILEVEPVLPVVEAHDRQVVRGHHVCGYWFAGLLRNEEEALPWPERPV